MSSPTRRTVDGLKPGRPRAFNVRVTQAEFDQVRALVEQYGVSSGSIVRMCIKRALGAVDAVLKAKHQPAAPAPAPPSPANSR